MITAERTRWPAYVYAAGPTPIPGSLANERTLLAWIRTSLGLIGAGVVIDAVELDVDDTTQRVVGAILVVLGGLAALGGWLRWASAERALRLGRPLPSPSLAAVLVAGLLAVIVVVAILSVSLRRAEAVPDGRDPAVLALLISAMAAVQAVAILVV